MGRIAPEPVPATNDTLWQIYSSTKVLVAAGIWLLVEDGALSFHDPVALHLPEFARHGKGSVTIHQVLTHQGGFPSALNPIDPKAWEDHELLRRLVCDITLEWTPGSRVHYHQRSAHWVAAAVIEAVSGTDFRGFLRERLLEPAGLQQHIYVGLPLEENARAADTHMASADGSQQSVTSRMTPGVPGRGHTRHWRDRHRDGLGRLVPDAAERRPRRQRQADLSPRLVEYVTRNFTGERVDGHMKMPMHRGLGPHSRGFSASIRGLGALAPVDFRTWRRRHFVLLGRSGQRRVVRLPDQQPGSGSVALRRLGLLSNCVHSAIGDA
ncbi:MAG: beta-lactamase family protein [Betaproteobacteria bacterium]|nr:beta-lactamase family protein [Betaproteobacteria bacterium]